MTNQKYILKDKKIIPVDLMTWAKWSETADRVVRQTEIIEGIKIGNKALGTPVKISTVFLGLDHNFGAGKPLLFETMIFGGKHDGYQERYSTYKEAEKGHQKALNLVKGIK